MFLRIKRPNAKYKWIFISLANTENLGIFTNFTQKCQHLRSYKYDLSY